AVHDRLALARAALRLPRAHAGDAADARPAGRLLRARLLLAVPRDARGALPRAAPRQRPGLLLQQRPRGLGVRADRDRSGGAGTRICGGDFGRGEFFRGGGGAGLAAAGNERSGVVIDLSADLGEGSPGEDDLWPLISAANV